MQQLKLHSGSRAGTPVVASQGILQKGVESMRAAGSAIRNGATNSWRGITASADWTKKAVSNGYLIPSLSLRDNLLTIQRALTPFLV